MQDWYACYGNSVCLSVRTFLAFIDCVEMAKYIMRLLITNTIILVPNTVAERGQALNT